VGQAVEQCRCHLGITENRWLFAEGANSGDDDRGALVVSADKVEQKLTAGLGEGQIAESVENNEVEAGQVTGDAALAVVAGFGLETIEEIDDIVGAAAGAGADAAAGDGDSKMDLAGAGAADQDDVALRFDETAASEISNSRASELFGAMTLCCRPPVFFNSSRSAVFLAAPPYRRLPGISFDWCLLRCAGPAA
jgi:hypothetical protein